MLKWFKILKKGSIVFLMGVFYLLSYNIIVKADNISVSNWYSDEKRVGYWNESPKVSFSNLSGQ